MTTGERSKAIVILIINFIVLGMLCLPAYKISVKYFIFIFITFNIIVNTLITLERFYQLFHKYRYFISILVFVVLVIFKIHGSSIAVWNSFINDRVEKSRDILLGEARMIRSDEWLVQTPLYLSQYSENVNFNKFNKNIRSDGEDVLISYYAPAKDISNIGKPFNWGFLFLDKEHGFSWYWCSKLILIFILGYEMFFFLSGGKKKISFLMSVYLALASPIQWWFSTMVVDLIIFAQGVIISFLYFIKNKEIYTKILNTILTTIFAIGFILSLYPPVQVPLGYIILIFLLFIVFKSYKEFKKSDFIYIITAVLFIISIVGISFLKSSDAIKMVMATVYPGKRAVTGGGYIFDYLGFYLANTLLPYKDTNILNQCEISRFIDIFPIIFLMPYFIYKREMKNKGLIYALYIFFIFQFSWLFVKYPAIVGKVTLFSYVPEFRAVLVLGLTGVYLTAILITAMISEPLKKVEAIIITLGTLLYIAYQGKYGVLNQYISFNELMVLIFIFTIFIYAILRGIKKLSLSLLITIVLVSGATVNPIARGLGSLNDKVVFKKIQEINQKENGAWVSLNDTILGNLLIASGVKTINGVQYYPDLNLWSKLDSEKKYENVYNRYSHVQIEIVYNETNFQLVGQDSFILKINYEEFGKLNAKYIITKCDLDEFNRDRKIFEKIYYNEVDRIIIYKYLG